MQSQSFTDKAKEALSLAAGCARSLKQGYIGTEHILAGLLKEGSGVAAKVLTENGVDLNKIMDMIRDLIAFENGTPVKEREGYSPRAQRILEEAHAQAQRFGQKETGTEHLALCGRTICDRGLSDYSPRRCQPMELRTARGEVTASGFAVGEKWKVDASINSLSCGGKGRYQTRII